MSTLAEATTQMTALTAQVTKIQGETSTLLQKIADLTAVIDAGGASGTTAEFDAALAALKTQVKVVDDLVVDEPATVLPAPN